MIDARELKKDYGDVRALDGLSFEVVEGAIFGLLGPNGAGKSTAVKVLTTLARADVAVVLDEALCLDCIAHVVQTPGPDHLANSLVDPPPLRYDLRDSEY